MLVGAGGFNVRAEAGVSLPAQLKHHDRVNFRTWPDTVVASTALRLPLCARDRDGFAFRRAILDGQCTSRCTAAS